MTEPTVPAWLNLDAVLTVEQRAQVPELVAATHDLVEAVTVFLERVVPAWRELGDMIHAERGTDVLDFWDQFIKELIGLDEVEDLVFLAQWALTVLTDGTASDEMATKYMGRLPAAATERLREALAKRDEAAD